MPMKILSTVPLMLQNLYHAYISISALGRIEDVAGIEQLIDFVEAEKLDNCDGLIVALKSLAKEIRERDVYFKCLRDTALSKAPPPNGGSASE